MKGLQYATNSFSTCAICINESLKNDHKHTINTRKMVHGFKRGSLEIGVQQF